MADSTGNLCYYNWSHANSGNVNNSSDKGCSIYSDVHVSIISEYDYDDYDTSIVEFPEKIVSLGTRSFVESSKKSRTGTQNATGDIFLEIIRKLQECWNKLYCSKKVGENWFKFPNPKKMNTYVILIHIANELGEFMGSLSPNLAKKSPKVYQAIKSVLQPHPGDEQDYQKSVVLNYLQNLSDDKKRFLTTILEKTFFNNKLCSIVGSKNESLGRKKYYCKNCKNPQRADIFCILKVIYNCISNDDPLSDEIYRFLKILMDKQKFVEDDSYDVGSDLVEFVEKYSANSNKFFDEKRNDVFTEIDKKYLTKERKNEFVRLDQIRLFFLKHNLAKIDKQPCYCSCFIRGVDFIPEFNIISMCNLCIVKTPLEKTPEDNREKTLSENGTVRGKNTWIGLLFIKKKYISKLKSWVCVKN